MNNLTELITSEIKKQYKSTRNFALSIGVPPTTLSSALKTELEGTSFGTVMKICEALNIKFLDNSVPIKYDDDVFNFINKYNSLDNYGKQTVRLVLTSEYQRCNSTEQIVGHLAAFEGNNADVSYKSEKLDEIHSIVRKIKNKD